MSIEIDESVMYSKADVARILKVSEQTVMRMHNSGELPGGKMVKGQWRWGGKTLAEFTSQTT